MQDLNDMYLFAQLVEHGGYSTASRALEIPKSRLSRRIAALEEHLGTRLVQRSTRTFAVTDAGRAFLEHCQAMIAEAEAAENAVAQIRAVPRGLIRISASIAMAHHVLAPILPRFMLDNPEVRVHVLSTNRIVHVIEENLDIALFVHRTPLQDSMLVMRMLGQSHQLLVASPRLFAEDPRPAIPEELKRFPALSVGGREHPETWELARVDGAKAATIFSTPRLVSDSLSVLKGAALAGVGVVRLPEFICRREIASGQLEVVLPGWSLPSHDIHAVYPSRKGMTPAVRSFIEYLADSISSELARR
jgi:DNA-binding transcriptional LysR family regulator